MSETTRPSIRPRPGEYGFSIIELLIATVILGILANITIYTYLDALLKAKATKIVTDFKFVEAAVTRYSSQSNDWPRDGSLGREPPELTPYLEGKIDWGRRDRRSQAIQYEWENWLRPNGQPRRAKTGVAIGFSVRTLDDKMLAKIQEIWDRPVYTTRDRLTFIIVPADPPPPKGKKKGKGKEKEKKGKGKGKG